MNDQSAILSRFNTDFKCEVCMVELHSKCALMEHYSGGHMESALKEQFGHLLKDGLCNICKYEPEEENEIWVHIGTLHEKVNLILQEKGLKPVGCKTNYEMQIPNKIGDTITEMEKGVKEVQLGATSNFDAEDQSTNGNTIERESDDVKIPNSNI